MQPKVSVIVPIYKVEKYINDCLNSLVNQSLEGIEIIMINDGTPDKSAKIAEQYALNYKNFILINKQNGGLADARNLGIKHARGEYITFLDSDDKLTSKACEILYNKAKDLDSDIVIGKPIWEFKDGTTKPLDYSLYWFNSDNDKNYRHNSKIVVGMPIATSKIFRADLIKENNIQFPKLIGEDIVFWLYIWHKAKAIHMIPNIVYLRTKRNEEGNKSITQRYSKDIVEDRLKALKIMDSYCNNNGLFEVKNNLKCNLGLIITIISRLENNGDQLYCLMKVKEYIDREFNNKSCVKKYLFFSYKELNLLLDGKIELTYLIKKYDRSIAIRNVIRKLYRKIIKY